MLGLLRRPAYILTPKTLTINGWITQRCIPWENISDISWETVYIRFSYNRIVITVPTQPIYDIFYRKGYRRYFGQTAFVKASPQQLVDVLERWHKHYTDFSLYNQ